jgi:hypothetical protein
MMAEFNTVFCLMKGGGAPHLAFIAKVISPSNLARVPVLKGTGLLFFEKI